MEADGFSLPVIEGALRLSAAGAVRRRARGADERRAAVAGARAVRLRSRASRRRRRARDGLHRSTPRSTAPAARAGCPSACGRCFHESARHRRRRLHRIDARRAAARDGADVVGIDCFTDYYPRAIKERNLAGSPGHPRFPLRRVAHPGRRPRGAARRPHARLSSGGAGRRPKELGTRFRHLHREQHRGDAGAARSLRGTPLERLVYASSSSVYGDNVADADARGRAAAAGVALRRHQAGGRAALLPLPRQLRRAGGVAALFHGLRPAAAARHGLPQVPAGGDPRRADHRLRRRRADARLHVRGRRRQPRSRRRDRGRSGPRVQYWRRVARLGQPGARDDRPRLGPPAARHRRSGAEGRHAAHLRRHLARARRPRLRAHASDSKRASRPSISG